MQNEHEGLPYLTESQAQDLEPIEIDQLSPPKVTLVRYLCAHGHFHRDKFEAVRCNAHAGWKGIQELNLSLRVHKTLWNIGILKIEQLLNFGYALKDMPGIGRKAFSEISESLARHGMVLGDPQPEITFCRKPR